MRQQVFFVRLLLLYLLMFGAAAGAYTSLMFHWPFPAAGPFSEMVPY